MDPSGGLLWNRDFIAIDEIEDAVAMNAAGDVFLAGGTEPSPITHGFVRKLDGATGALTWQRRLGDDDDIELLGDVATRENGAIVAIGSVNVLQLLPDDEIHRAGTFAGTITLGERTLVAATAQDTFLAKVGF